MSAVEVQAAPEQTGLKQLSKTTAVFCLMLLAAAYITNAMDRHIFPTLLPMISKQMGFGLKSGGFVATVFNFGIALTGIPAGYLIDRWSRKAVLVSGMVVYSLFTLMTIFGIGLWDMTAYRALTGVGEAMQIAALYVAAGSYFYRNRAFVVGCINVGYGIGSTLGPSFGTRLAVVTGSWKPPFVVFCMIGLVMAALVWVLIPRAFSERKALQHLSVVDQAAVANVPDELWNWNTRLIAPATLCLGTIMWGFLGLYPTYLRTQLHFSPTTVATIFSIYGFGCMLPMLGGWIGDRYSNRGALIVAYSAVSVVTYCIYHLAKLPWEHYILSFLMAALCSSTLHVNTLALLQRSVRPEKTGRATGLFTSLHFLGGGFSGFLFGALVDKFGWANAGLLQETMLPILAVFLLLAVKPELQWQSRGLAHK
jgi:MFS family permease